MRTRCKSPPIHDVSWTKHAHTQHVIHVQLHPQVMMQEDMTLQVCKFTFVLSTLPSYRPSSNSSQCRIQEWPSLLTHNMVNRNITNKFIRISEFDMYGFCSWIGRFVLLLSWYYVWIVDVSTSVDKFLNFGRSKL